MAGGQNTSIVIAVSQTQVSANLQNMSVFTNLSPFP